MDLFLAIEPHLYAPPRMNELVHHCQTRANFIPQYVERDARFFQ